MVHNGAHKYKSAPKFIIHPHLSSKIQSHSKLTVVSVKGKAVRDAFFTQ